MKFSISLDKVKNYKVFARRAGYAMIYDRHSGQESFVRRLSSGHYPRLHLYIEERGRDLVFSLHLDQKKASYQGFSRHSAEYDHELVREEIDRLKELLGYRDLATRESLSMSKNSSVSREELDKMFGLDTEEDKNNNYEPF